MNKTEIKKFIEQYQPRKNRTMVIVDFANVDKWEPELGWKVGIQELACLVKNFSAGQKYLRRFYYGADYGKNDKSDVLTEWSDGVLSRAKMNGFEIIQKRVKYIVSSDNKFGYEKKCDLDVEMALDAIIEQENYDNLIFFSGDGDLACVMKYLNEKYYKKIYVFGARDRIGREIIDAKNNGTIEKIFFADDFEYRLNPNRKRH